LKSTSTASTAKSELLEAARQTLMLEGYSGLSTRRVAEAANTQMSQIQYHFGSKEGLILALFADMNETLLHRQDRLLEQERMSFSDRWEIACDYLEEDILSGYVRVLQELMAAGWSNPRIRKVVVEGLNGWQDVLRRFGRQAEVELGSLGPFTVDDFAALAASAFLGAESMGLLGIDAKAVPIKTSLRKVSELFRMIENQSG